MKTEIFEIYWKFWNLMKFWKISEFSLKDDEVQVFRINIKLLSNPVVELKIWKRFTLLNSQTTGKGEK